MSLTTGPMTELDAVNKMLDGIFESPVSSIDAPGVSDVGLAISILNDVKREVLLPGWHFNKEEAFTLALESVTGYCPIPNNTLRVDTHSSDHRNVAQRGTRLYNVTDHTYVFTSPVVVDLTLNLAWDDLPEYAKGYIAMRAARRFQESVLGSGNGRYRVDDENAAKGSMEDAEGDTADHNVLTGSWGVANTLYQNRRF